MTSLVIHKAGERTEPIRHKFRMEASEGPDTEGSDQQGTEQGGSLMEFQTPVVSRVLPSGEILSKLSPVCA